VHLASLTPLKRDLVAVKVVTKVELGVALRMDPHGWVHKEGGKEFAVCRAQAECISRCKSDEVARWWLGMRTLAQQKECLWSLHFVRDGYTLNKWQGCNRGRKGTRNTIATDFETQSMVTWTLRNYFYFVKNKKFCC